LRAAVRIIGLVVERDLDDFFDFPAERLLDDGERLFAGVGDVLRKRLVAVVIVDVEVRGLERLEMKIGRNLRVSQ
jgi:hypothetical protein